MKFEGTKVWGWQDALIGMRLPMCKDYEESKSKIDSVIYQDGVPLKIGEGDLRILKNLIKADNCENKVGQPNSKVLRMIHVQVSISAPMYFWSELDTYKIGTVANSTSKMHKLASTPITLDCFEMGDFNDMKPREHIEKDEYGNESKENNLCNFISLELFWKEYINVLEDYRVHYNETKDKRYWKELIRLLPESWIQTRMFDCNYETLRNIYCWRCNHKLTEWHTFCDWIRTLPYSKDLITGEKE